MSFSVKMYLHLLLASVVVTFVQSVKSYSLNFFDLKIFDDDNSKTIEDDANLNIQQLAAKYKYNLKEHEVITEDGYKLTLHRFGNHKENSVPILLMHGILDSADSWILQGPDNSLGHILADRGYDVWLGNARGNKYSLSHVEFSVADQKFWNFTWEEIGIYDLPATIDYILNTTESNDLYYVGHSQGTTSFYVMNALKPEYNKKIKMMFAMAPVAWMEHVESPILRYVSNIIASYSYIFNVYSPSTGFLNLISSLCGIFTSNCGDFLTTFIGADNNLIKRTLLPVIFGHYPTSSSTLQLVHYGQLMNSGRFCRFDYGAKNMIKYGTNSPPDYNLDNLTVPIVLFYSNNDKLSHVTDVYTLHEHLPNVSEAYNTNNFNHFDYMYASIAKDIVYVKILNKIRSFERTFTGNKFRLN